ncbi:hypothetical protein ACYSNW_10920 [Enterococcus sp. LJL99]
MNLSNSFEISAKEAPEYQTFFSQLVQNWGNISSLEEKTKH